jgi:hypothetical protein
VHDNAVHRGGGPGFVVGLMHHQEVDVLDH